MKKMKRLEIQNQFLREQLEKIRKIANEPMEAEDYNPYRQLGRIDYLSDYEKQLEYRMQSERFEEQRRYWEEHR